MTPHEQLPASYLASCEKFFRALGKKRNKFQASSSNATRHNLFTEIEERSRKRQASSTKQQGPGFPDSCNNLFDKEVE